MTCEMDSLSARVNDVLRPLGITRSMKAHRILCGCEWKAIQSMVRRAAKTAWSTAPERVQEMAGYPLTGCPTAVQFLEMVYNAVVRGE